MFSQEPLTDVLCKIGLSINPNMDTYLNRVTFSIVQMDTGLESKQLIEATEWKKSSKRNHIFMWQQDNVS